MNGDLLAIIDYLQRDRGLDRDIIIRVIEEAIESAARKALGSNKLEVKLNPKSGDISAVAQMTAVETVTDYENEIKLRKAKEKFPDAKEGDLIDWEISPEELGRIVAQTTRQGIFQRLRKVEKDLIREDYKERIGEILHGSVTRFEKGDVVIDFGDAEGLMRHKERIPTEEYQVGDPISCLLVDVNMNKPGPVLVVSRAHDNFLRRLFERESTEISENIVTIKSVAREPGYRAKIAVVSKDSQVDPVGACVGVRGNRVKTIVRELNGEKVDIIRWDQDISKFVSNALQPAEIMSITVDEEAHQVNILVDKDQLSLAIGKRGQNARLTHRLTGWKVDIKKEEQVTTTIEDRIKQVTNDLASKLNVPFDIADKLVSNGYISLEGIKAVSANEISEIDGIDEATAKQIIEAVS